MLAICVGFGQATTGSGGFNSQTCCSPAADPVVSIGSSPWAPRDVPPVAEFCWLVRDSDLADHCVTVYGAERASRRARRRARRSSMIRRSCSIFPRVAWFSRDSVTDSSMKSMPCPVLLSVAAALLLLVVLALLDLVGLPLEASTVMVWPWRACRRYCGVAHRRSFRMWIIVLMSLLGRPKRSCSAGFRVPENVPE